MLFLHSGSVGQCRGVPGCADERRGGSAVAAVEVKTDGDLRADFGHDIRKSEIGVVVHGTLPLEFGTVPLSHQKKY